MLSCLIYLTLTTFIPLKLTYHALKSDPKQTSLWSHYWAFYFIIHLLASYMPFFENQPFQFILLLLQLWLYSEHYKGALYLSKLIKSKAVEFQLEQHLNLIVQKIKIVGIFEENAILEDKQTKTE